MIGTKLTPQKIEIPQVIEILQNCQVDGMYSLDLNLICKNGKDEFTIEKGDKISDKIKYDSFINGKWYVI